MDTSVLPQLLLSGLATGGIYASLALALVMIHRATHLVNFAQGEMATFATYLAWSLMQAGMPYWTAFALTVLLSFAGGVLIERIVIRPVERAPVLAAVIVFIGLLLMFNSLAGWIFGTTIRPFPSPFHGPLPSWSPHGLSAHELGAAGVTLLLLLALFSFFRFTPLGLAMRAAAQNPESSRLVGVRVGWMLALGWGLASAIGAVAGMMVAPVVFLEPNMMGGVLLYAFAGALLGGIDSPGGAVLGGLLVGVLENVAGAWVGTELRLSVALALIVGVLVVRPTGLFGRARAAGVSLLRAVPDPRPAPDRACVRSATVGRERLLWLMALLALAGALPFALSDYRVFQLTLAGSYAIALLGLNLLTGFNGQISLGHGAFLALGAYTAAILMAHGGVPYWATVPAAGAVCLAAGFLFGLPALRLQGPYLALATFALGVAMPQLLKHKQLEPWTGGVQGIVLLKPDTPPWLPGLSPDRWLYFFTLAWLLLMCVSGWNLVRGRIGRAMVALREQPVAAQAMGVNAALVKSLTFGVSALYAGVAGALGAVAVQFVAPDSFNVFLSLSLVVGIVVGGLATIQGALWGALFIEFVPNVADQLSRAAPWAVYGLLLIVCTVFMPGGVAGFMQQLRQMRQLRQQRRHGAAAGFVIETKEEAG